MAFFPVAGLAFVSNNCVQPRYDIARSDTRLRRISVKFAGYNGNIDEALPVKYQADALEIVSGRLIQWSQCRQFAGQYDTFRAEFYFRSP